MVTHPVARGADQDTRDWTYVRKDGSRLTVSVSVTAVRDDDGDPVSYLSVVRDVTDRRAAEQALVFALDKERETNQRMLDLDRAKGEFVSAVSHELRTPLTSIVGYTELLADDLSGEPHRRAAAARRAHRPQRRAAAAPWSRTCSRWPASRTATSPSSASRPTCATPSGSPPTRSPTPPTRAGSRCAVDLPTEPVLLEGDPAYLERLVLNLVSNAVKFTDAGGEVDVAPAGDRRGGRADASRDTGMGIPLEEQGRLFQRFFRSSLATEHAIQGTGLGLHIVRSIAEAHHGEVSFESTPGVGHDVLVHRAAGRHAGRRTHGPDAADAGAAHAPGQSPVTEAPRRLGRGAALTLEVEPGLAVAEPLGRHRVDVALAQHDVELRR